MPAGESTGQDTTGSRTLPASSSNVELLTWNGGEADPPRQVYVSLSDASGVVELTLRRRWLYGETEMAVFLGGGGAVVLPVAGSFDLLATSANGAEVTWGLQRHAEPAPWPGAIDLHATLNHNGAGGAGAWIDLGWTPGERLGLCLYPLIEPGTSTSLIEMQLRDEAGNVRAHWGIQEPQAGLIHPPRFRLRARHAGGGTDTRGLVAAWTRGT